MNKGLIIVASMLMLALVMGCGKKMTEEQLYAQALDFQNKQQWDDVAKTYEKLVSTYPESEKADEHMYNLGMVYANNVKDYDSAIKTWKKLLENYSKSRLVVNTKFMIGYCPKNLPMKIAIVKEREPIINMTSFFILLILLFL